jgi:hypothetical protein
MCNTVLWLHDGPVLRFCDGDALLACETVSSAKSAHVG